MAAAAMHTLRDLPHKLRKASQSNNNDPPTPSQPRRHASITPTESRQERHEHEHEKKQILHWEADKHTLAPEEIAKRGEDKHVGWSSHRLRLDDFDLLKTLGTG